MPDKNASGAEIVSSSLLAVAKGMRLYRVMKPVPSWYGWNCAVGDELFFPAQDNMAGWRDVAGLSRCATAKMWVSVLIADETLMDITDSANTKNQGQLPRKGTDE